MWTGLRGKWGYKAGASGSPVVAKGVQILRIWARSAAGGTVAINGGDAIPIIAGAAPLLIDTKHLNMVAGSTTPVVFTGTDSFYLEFLDPTS